MAVGRARVVEETAYGTVVEEGGQLHFVKEYSFTEQEAYQAAFIECSRRLSEKHEHVLSAERSSTKVENSFCSTFYKITVVYEYLGRTLQDELEQRLAEERPFDEKEVWSVLCSCVLAMSEVVSLRGRAHAALRPSDLRLTKDAALKLLHWEMVGEEEGTPHMLAQTVMQCLGAHDLQRLHCSAEMRSILQLMVREQTTFGEVEEHLFKLVQEDS